jgi:hypothetical protein
LFNQLFFGVYDGFLSFGGTQFVQRCNPPLCAAQIAKVADTFQYTGRNTPMQQQRDGRWMTAAECC